MAVPGGADLEHRQYLLHRFEPLGLDPFLSQVPLLVLSLQAELLYQVNSTGLEDELVVVFEPVDDQAKPLQFVEETQIYVVLGEFLVACKPYTRGRVLRLAGQEGKMLAVCAKVEPLDHEFAEGLPPVFRQYHQHIGPDGVLVLLEATMRDDRQKFQCNFERHLLVRLLG